MNSWNLSLDANLLPKRHASGGESDIVIDYPRTKYYPKHKLMVEVTLTNDTNQRRAEMEPVSRHLGVLKAKNTDMEVYGVFISNYLDVNVIVDLRGRKNLPFYDRATGTWVSDNKLLPMNTENIKKILVKNLSYKFLYNFLNEAYLKDVPFQNWYEETINIPLNNL